MKKSHLVRTILHEIIPYLITFLKIYITLSIIFRFGLIFGVIITIILLFSYKLFIEKIFKLESLSGIDKFFVGYTDREKFNIVCLMIFQKFSSEKIKHLLIEKAVKKIPKMRKRLTYKLFDFYWEETTIEEAISKIKIINNSNVNSEEDLLTFMENEVNNHINIFEDLPYEIKLIELKDNKGAMILKFDHSFSDGLGILSAICTLADNYDINVYPSKMKHANQKYLTMSWIQKLINFIVIITYFPKFIYMFFFVGTYNTPFLNKSKYSTGRTKFSLSKQYELNKFDKIRKYLNITFNEFFICVLSKTIRELCEKLKIETNIFKTKLKCSMAVGLKTIPKDINDIKLNNEANGVVFTIPLIKDIRKEYQSIVEILKSTIKNYGQVVAPMFFAKILAEFFPHSTIMYFEEKLMHSLDLLLSNVPGPCKPLYFAGSKLEFVAPFASTSRTKAFIPIVSYNNHFRFLIAVDADSGIDHKEILRMMENEIDSLIIKYN